jgi:hypothetical protein
MAPRLNLARELRRRELALSRDNRLGGSFQDQHDMGARQESAQGLNQRRAYSQAIAAWIDGQIPPAALADNERRLRLTQPPEPTAEKEVEPKVTQQKNRAQLPVGARRVRCRPLPHLSPEERSRTRQHPGAEVLVRRLQAQPLSECGQLACDRRLPGAVRPDHGHEQRTRTSWMVQHDLAPEREFQ